MITPPKQDWDLYRKITQDAERQYLQNLTPKQRYVIYRDLFQFVCNARRQVPTTRPNDSRWQEKLKRRIREVTAFHKLDHQKK